MTPERNSSRRFEPLAKRHNRAAFLCTHPELTLYLKQFAFQHARKGIAATTVLLVDDDEAIIAFHTLSATAIDPGELKAELSRKFPKYAEGIPATLLGRLAVDLRHLRKRHGEAILMNAIERAFQSTSAVASAFLIVRAIDDDAFRFYKRYGFTPFPDDPRRLFLPMATVAELVKGMLDYISTN